jgi:hypothetical protein
MGVKLNVVANDIQDNPNKNTKGKDIRADDLNGKLEDIPNLRKNKPTDFKCLKHYLIAANKYELHLTAQDVPRDLDLYDKAIPIIIKMIDECFYSQSNQNIRAELISKNKLPSDYFS